MRRKYLLFCSTGLSVSSLMLATPTARAQLRSFGEAEGFGAAATTGARASAAPTIYHVTNLNDSGAGSFRDAVSASNRIVVFDVGGNINLASAVLIHSNTTIAGQTAPGGGIYFTGGEVSCSSQSNIIMRHIRVSPGDASGSTDDALALYNSKNIVADHCSFNFAKYDNIDAVTDNGASPQVTIQNCLIGDPIGQQFGAHLEAIYGNFTLTKNLWVNSHNRNPLAKVNEQFINNVNYNYEAAYTTHTSTPFDHDLVNNMFIYGPATSGNTYYQLSSGDTFYAVGNTVDSDKDGNLDTTTISNPTTGTIVSTPNFASTPSLPTMSVADAYKFVVAHAGASLTRDELDNLIVSQVQTLGAGTAGKTAGTSGPTGGLYGSAASTGLSNGGLGSIASASRPAGFDSDNDGIPDAWETAHGMNPNSAADALQKNPFGYFMIEQYINEIGSVNDSRTFTATSGSFTTAANWSIPAGGSSAAPGVMDYALIRGNGVSNASVTHASGTATAMELSIGGNGPVGGAGETLTVSGGLLDVYDTVTIGDQGNATLNVNGGVLDTYLVQLGNTLSGNNYTGTLNLNGGTLNASQVALGAGAPSAWTSGGNINGNGGTLRAVGTLLVNAPTTLNAGGLAIDTNGYAGTFSGLITGPGTLTKKGSGTLLLTGSNSYGATTLQGGELDITSDANIGGAASIINFSGGMLGLNSTSLTSINSHTVNWSTFNGGFAINAAFNFVFSQNLSGSGTFTLGGTTGSLTLSGTNSYTGGTVITGSQLIVTDDANLGAVGAPVTLSGGRFRVNGTTFTSLANHPFTLVGSSGIIDINTAGNVFTIPSNISGSGAGFTKAGAGVLVLSGSNTFTGPTTLSAGTLRLSNALALRRSTLTMNTAGTLVDFNGIAPTLGGISGNQPLDNQGLLLTVGSNNGSTTYSGIISGTGGLTKIGTGTLTLNAANTFSGSLTIQAGTVAIDGLADAGVAADLGTGQLVLNGGTLQYNSTATTTSNRTFTLEASGGTLDGGTGGQWRFLSTAAVSVPGTASRTLTLTGSTTLNDFYLGLSDPAGGTGKTTLVMNGSGRWILTTPATPRSYSGDTIINAGTLMQNFSDQLPYGVGKGNLVVNAGGTFELNSRSVNVNALNGAGTVNQRSGTGTLTLGNGNASGTFSGIISDAGTLSVLKVGTGTETLSGTANSYGGTTTINAGVLEFSNILAIGGSGASVQVNAGGTASAGYALDQAFLARINSASLGTVALDTASANALNFSTPGLTSVTLGSVGANTFTGTIVPAGATFRLGGGGGTLTLGNAGTLYGANSVVIGGNSAFGTVIINNTQTYTGSTTIKSGATLIALLVNGGAASGLGLSSNAAANLVLDGGTLRGSGSTDRAFSLTSSGGTLDNTSNGIFNGTGAIGLPAASVTLTLTGSSLGNILFAPALGDPASGSASINKTGSGRWSFSSSNTKTYSGDTHISAGILEALAPNAFSPNSNVVVDSGATFDIRGNSNAIDALSGAGIVSNTNGSAAQSLTVGANNGSGTFSGLINAALSLVKTGSGSQTLSGSYAYLGDTTVNGGALILTNGLTASSSLTINAGVVRITGSGKAVTAPLTLAGTPGNWSGQLDIQSNNALIVATTPATKATTATTLADQLVSGRANNWSGNGITSSSNPSDPTGNLTLALYDNADLALASFNGQPLTPDSLLVTRALAGDANMDGNVDLADYDRWYANVGGTLGVTSRGDFNLDGNIDLADYDAWYAHVGATGSPLLSQPASASPIPEPTSLALLAASAPFLLRRRRTD